MTVFEEAGGGLAVAAFAVLVYLADEGAVYVVACDGLEERGKG